MASWWNTALTAVRLDPRFKERLVKLIAASNGRVTLGEGWRSSDTQRKMFLDRYRPGPGRDERHWNGQVWHRVKGAAAAPPGGSMHEIGLAADLKGDLNWVQQHAAEFGLKTFANVNGEPWHVQIAEFPNSRREYEASSYANQSTINDLYSYSDRNAPPDHTLSDVRSWMFDQNYGFATWLQYQDPDQQKQIIAKLSSHMSLPQLQQYLTDKSTPQQVRDYLTKFLAVLPADKRAEQIKMLKVDPSLWPPDPAGPSPALAQLLKKDFGIDYPNAPQPTPALMAFLRGLGMDVDTAGDVRAQALGQIKVNQASSLADIARNSAREVEDITGGLVSRGVLRSGEANTRYADQAADVAAKRSDVYRTSSQSSDLAEETYQQARDAARQQALEAVLNRETDQKTAEETARAQAEAYRKAREAEDRAYERERQARQDALDQLTNPLATPA